MIEPLTVIYGGDPKSEFSKFEILSRFVSLQHISLQKWFQRAELVRSTLLFLCSKGVEALRPLTFQSRGFAKAFWDPTDVLKVRERAILLVKEGREFHKIVDVMGKQLEKGDLKDCNPDELRKLVDESKKTKNKITSRQNKRFICNKCLKGFSNNFNMVRHQRTSCKIKK